MLLNLITVPKSVRLYCKPSLYSLCSLGSGRGTSVSGARNDLYCFLKSTRGLGAKMLGIVIGTESRLNLGSKAGTCRCDDWRSELCSDGAVLLTGTCRSTAVWGLSDSDCTDYLSSIDYLTELFEWRTDFILLLITTLLACCWLPPYVCWMLGIGTIGVLSELLKN